MNQPTVDNEPAQKERLLSLSMKAFFFLWCLTVIPWFAWAGKMNSPLSGTPGMLVGFFMGVLFVVTATAGLRFVELSRIVGNTRWTTFWFFAYCVTFIASLKLVDHYFVDMARLVCSLVVNSLAAAIILTAVLVRLRRANRIINGEIKGPPDTKNLTDDDLSGKPLHEQIRHARPGLSIIALIMVANHFYYGWVGEFKPELTGWHGSSIAGFFALFLVVCGFCLLRIIEVRRSSSRRIWLWVACGILVLVVSAKVLDHYFIGVSRTYAGLVASAIMAAILLTVLLVQLKRVNRDRECNS